MKEFWDQRYAVSEYVYGIEPNSFFRKMTDNITPGRILLPGDGEGRNSVYAAMKGWEVDSFDYSPEAKKKALQLAEINKVKLNYQTLDIVDFKERPDTYDAVAVVFLHISLELRVAFHEKLIKSLKSGGVFIAQYFSKKQIDYNSGGPKDIDLLYGPVELKKDFPWLDFEIFNEEKTDLEEGSFHKGEAFVINIFGRKQ